MTKREELFLMPVQPLPGYPEALAAPAPAPVTFAAAPAPATRPAALTPEQLSICRQLRLKPETFAAALAVTPGEPIKATDLSLAEAIEIQRQHASRATQQ